MLKSLQKVYSMVFFTLKTHTAALKLTSTYLIIKCPKYYLPFDPCLFDSSELNELMNLCFGTWNQKNQKNLLP